MDKSVFKEMDGQWPVRHPVSYGKWHVSGFGVVRPAPDAAPVALIRDATQNEGTGLSLAERLIALDEVKRAGVEVVPHLPFRGRQGDFLITKYLGEAALWKGSYGYLELLSERQVKKVLGLAKNLGRYYLDRFKTGGTFVHDISDPFQYVMDGDTPRLVDLDLHVSARDIPLSAKELRDTLTSIGMEYSNFLTDDRQREELAVFLDEAARSAEPYSSIRSADGSYIVSDDPWVI